MSDNLVEKEDEKVLRGGGNTAVLKVCVEVCLCCKERLYSQQTVRRFEQNRSGLSWNAKIPESFGQSEYPIKWHS